MSNTLFNTKGAAKFLGMSPRSLEGMRVDGSGPPFVKISDRCIRYRLSDIESWLASKVQTRTDGEGK